jgi:hypothetical protein
MTDLDSPGRERAEAERQTGRTGGGESGGGSVPHPRTGKARGGLNGFFGHGGQSEISYHGSGRLGDDEVEANEPTGKTPQDGRDSEN